MPTLSERLDTILININTLSQLQIHDRPIFSSRIVTIRQYSPYWGYINSIIRTIAGESRGDVIEGFNNLYTMIEKLVSEYIEHLQFYTPPTAVNAKTIACQYVTQLNKLRIAIPKLYNTDKIGLNAVIDTYEGCPEIISQFQVIIDHYKTFYQSIDCKINDLKTAYGITIPAE
jgi:hypothetical protein